MDEALTEASDDASQSATRFFRRSLEESERSTDDERRRSRRHAFRFVQWMAPCSDPNVSLRGLRFLAVRCCDLSTSGLSFLAATPPTFQYLVVRLGTADDPVYVLGEIVRSTPVGDADSECLVACRFLRKITGW